MLCSLTALHRAMGREASLWASCVRPSVPNAKQASQLRGLASEQPTPQSESSETVLWTGMDPHRSLLGPGPAPEELFNQPKDLSTPASAPQHCRRLAWLALQLYAWPKQQQQEAGLVSVSREATQKGLLHPLLPHPSQKGPRTNKTIPPGEPGLLCDMLACPLVQEGQWKIGRRLAPSFFRPSPCGSRPFQGPGKGALASG